jgi:hypothetical protein
MIMEARLQCGTPPPDNGGLFCLGVDQTAVRVRLPGGAGRVINKFATGGFLTDSSALGLPGFRPTWKRWQYKGTRGRNGNGVVVGSFELGRSFKKDHVVRSCLGVLPNDHSNDHAERSGPLSFREDHFKPVHMRVGFLPRPSTAINASQVVPNPLQPVYWHHPSAGAAVESLKKAETVKVDPGIRRLSEAPAGARLRQRARWALSLNPDKQDRWLGPLLKGRWTPDLSKEYAPAASRLFVAARGGSVKFLGGGTLKKTIGEGPERRTLELAYVNAVSGDTCYRLYPELLARLASYATFRKRSSVLVTALRTRALEWAKKQGFTAEETAEMLPPTVALAYLPSAQEIAGQEILREASTDGALPEAHGWWASDI